MSELKSFLESLSTTEHEQLINTIMEGYNTIFEASAANTVFWGTTQELNNLVQKQGGVVNGNATMYRDMFEASNAAQNIARTKGGSPVVLAFDISKLIHNGASILNAGRGPSNQPIYNVSGNIGVGKLVSGKPSPAQPLLNPANTRRKPKEPSKADHVQNRLTSVGSEHSNNAKHGSGMQAVGGLIGMGRDLFRGGKYLYNKFKK